MREELGSRHRNHEETDYAGRSDRERRGIGRREYLRLVGIGGVTAATVVGAVGTASASSQYTTYTVNAGETFRRTIGSDETFEDVLIDATADDTDVQIDAYGSNWAIRNVGIKGQLDSTNAAAFTLQVNGGSTSVFENVYLGDGAVDGGHGGIFVPTTHEGTVRISECNVQYWPDNGEYASAPGRSEHGGRGGLVEISRSYARNNNVSGFRLGTDRSVVRDSVVVVDDDVPANASGKVNARGIWVKEGGSVTIENCDILLAHPDGNYCVWEGDDNAVSFARVIDSEVAATNGADGRFRGNVETRNVGNDPIVDQPPDVPTSAKEAALGRNLPKIIDIAGGTDGDELRYAFETTGEIAGTRSTEPGDTVADGRASGTSHGESDRFRYDGEITTLDVSLPENGAVASVTVGRSAGRIDFDCGRRNEDRLDYYVRVTGSITPTGNVNNGDAHSGDEAKGWVGNGGRDTYEYTGDVGDLRVRLADGALLAVDIGTTE